MGQRRTVLALLTVLLTGCSPGVQGPAYQKAVVAPATSAVYVYRPQDHVPKVVIAAVPLGLGTHRPAINCQGQAIAIGPGGFHRFVVRPGPVSCGASTENTSTAQLDAKPGHSYYLKESFSAGIEAPRIELEPIDPNVAQSEISQCKEQ